MQSLFSAGLKEKKKACEGDLWEKSTVDETVSE